MAGDILSIGKSALFAAQTGLTTTGHNISNANVAGYSRQGVVQANSAPISTGAGFIGTGTSVVAIKRFSDEFLNNQVRTATASSSALDAFNTQISQIDNIIADSSAGLSPAMQNFFSGVQSVANDHGSVASRQSLLSTAQTLAGRFQALDGQLQDIRSGVDGQITANVNLINSYASQIADLNNQITGMAGAGSSANLPNDLLDKRDQLVLELNKIVKANVTPGDGNSLTVSIGNGMPLVLGKQSFQLTTTSSPTDGTRVEVALATSSSGRSTILNETILQGGALGGLLDFRNNVLDKVQNELGKVAAGLAFTFNAQHKLGLDANGQPGQDFFTLAPIKAVGNVNNAPGSTTAIGVAISDPTQLTGSDYKVDYDGANFTVTRLSDNKKTTIAPYPQTGPQTIDGLDFSVSGSAATGDNFLVRPTSRAAATIAVALTDTAQIAAAAPVMTSSPMSNMGTAKISAGAVSASFLNSGVALPMTLSYDAASGSLSGFDPALPVTVTDVNGASTTYPAGAANIPYPAAGATYAVGGVSFSISAGMKDTDQFTVAATTQAAASGDVRNANLLGDLQSTNIFDNGKATYQGSYAKLTSFVGNKARESQVNGEAANALLTQATSSAQSVSGVNLDEEATNLLRYQQAYQASSKIMQIAQTVFNSLLQLGN